ncbi:MAG: hypothetical protein ACP5FK_09005 [bacterium]
MAKGINRIMNSRFIIFDYFQYKLISPFSSRSCVEPGENVDFGDLVFERSYPQKNFLFDLGSYLGTNNPEIIEKNLKIGCNQSIPLYSNFSSTDNLPPGVKPLSPFNGKILKLVYPYGLSVAQKNNEQNIVINVSDPLGVSPHQISKFLLVKKGECINRGTKLAARTLNDDLTELTAVSPFDGEVISIDKKSGNIIIKKIFQEQSVKALIPGQVMSLQETPLGSSATIVSAGILIKGLTGFGSACKGHIELIESNFDQNIDRFQSTRLSNSIVVLNGIPSESVIEKLIKAGVQGMVIPSITPPELRSSVIKYKNKLSILGLFWSKIERLPENVLNFFKFRIAQWAILSVETSQFNNTLFIPTPLPPTIQYKDYLPSPGSEVIILSGKYKNKIGKLQSIQHHLADQGKTAYIPKALIKLKGIDETVNVPINNIYY